MSDSIQFQAVFYKAITTIDGGLRVSLDLPLSQASSLVDLIKLQGRTLEVAIVAHPSAEKRGF